jgi:hypothetical protein
MMQELQEVAEETQVRAAQQAFSALHGWMAKSTCMVVGPGLGNDPVMHKTARLALKHAREQVRQPCVTSRRRTRRSQRARHSRIRALLWYIHMRLWRALCTGYL